MAAKDTRSPIGGSEAKQNFRTWLKTFTNKAEFNESSLAERDELRERFERSKRENAREERKSTMQSMLQLIMASRVNPYAAMSASHSSKDGSVATRNDSVAYYGLQDENVCEVLGAVNSSTNVINAHIWPRHAAADTIIFDLQPDQVHAPQNVLRLQREIERAFDKQFMPTMKFYNCLLFVLWLLFCQIGVYGRFERTERDVANEPRRELGLDFGTILCWIVKFFTLGKIDLCAPTVTPAPTPAPTQDPCMVTVSPGTNVLQPAIDSAVSGDIICLTEGNYIQNTLVTINKSVQIWGPQQGVDPRPSFGSTRTAISTDEAKISGSNLSNIISIEADDVVLDGVVVSTGSGDLVRSLTATPVEGVVIRYSIITGSTGDEGMQLRACTNCLVEYNHVFNTAGDGINLCCSSKQGTIQFNEVHDSASTDGAIYIYTANAITIADNLVYDATVNEGIKIGAGCNSNPATNVDILRNEIRDTAQDGINTYSDNTKIEQNDVSGSMSVNGAIYIQCDGTTGFLVDSNFIHDNGATTKAIRVGDIGNAGVGDGIIISNCIENNSVGVSYDGPALLLAGNNWFDSNGINAEATGGGTVDLTPLLSARPTDCGLP